MIISSVFSWNFPISILQMKKFTRNKINIIKRRISYDSLKCVVSISILAKPIPITES